jgi:methyltransferase-like protein/trans-aconitate methyltransferase
MEEQNTYDEILYPDMPFQRTHPNRTAVIAALFGLTPPNPERARILELGCATGANLLPMGVELPNAELLGLDLSARQIETGEAVRSAAGISNVTLRKANLLDFDGSQGKYDYIIAHGLFSWVPESVQDKILSICRDNLAPNGVACVSYNVNPGWYFRGGLRDMMLYHVAGFRDARTRVQQARALLDFLATHGKAGPYADMLKAEAELIRVEPDGYIYHDHLERENRPIHFHEFVDRVRAKGLSYLGETELSSMTSKLLKPETAEVLDRISGGDLIRMGQYMDFLGNRAYRESLLVHAEEPIQRRLDWRPIRSMWVSSTLKPEDPAFDPESVAPATFVTPTGTEIRLKDPFTKVALTTLLERCPQPVPFRQVLEATRARLRSRRSVEQDETQLGEYILEAYGVGVIDVVASPWLCTAIIKDKPRTSALARFQAQSGRSVANLLHQRIDVLSADHRGLIELLDGEHTVEQVIDIMFQRVDLQRLPDNAKALANDPVGLRRMFADSMRTIVTELRDRGLLL